MSQYLLVIIWLAIIYVASQLVNVYTYEDVMGVEEKRVKPGFAIITVLPLIWWAATRSQWLFDTNVYVKAYTDMPSSLSGLSSYLETIEKDKGFSVLSVFIKSLVGNNWTNYFLILALIKIVLLALVYRKYSTHYIVALFLFITTTDYVSWMQNGIRQFTAVMIIFAATGLMLKKKYIPVIAVILLASTIHGSALLMIPMVLIAQGKPWNQKTLMAIVVFAIAIFYVDQFTDLLDVLLDETQYTNVVTDWQEGGDDGTNPIRVLVYAIPTILSIVGYRQIKEADDPVISFACNMGIMSTLLYCISTVTSGIFIGRLPIYCSLYATGILLPWELDNLFTKESTRIIWLGTIVGFLAFYYYQMHFTWGLI